MRISVENGGILTTVQDEGRFGYEQFGVSCSGPMDYRAMHIGNILVGNPVGESCLEATIMGPTLRFDGCAVAAVTGADCTPMLNGRPTGMYRAFRVGAGDILAMGMVKKGCRSYLCISGGIDVPEVMGSRSTMVTTGFGGFEGRKLKKGDVLDIGKCSRDLPDIESRYTDPAGISDGVHELRVIMGPQDDMFTEQGVESFLSGVYTVGQEFNRQGYRLEGPKIEHKVDGNIISDGIVTGSVQVPTDGHPIVMLSEHQTVGGYTKIATVITADLPVIGQCRAGDRISFRAVSVDEAQDLYAAHYDEMEALRKKLDSAKRHRPASEMIVIIGANRYNVKVEKMED